MSVSRDVAVACTALGFVIASEIENVASHGPGAAVDAAAIADAVNDVAVAILAAVEDAAVRATRYDEEGGPRG